MCLLLVLALVLSFSPSEAKKDIVIPAKSLGRDKELGVNYGNFKAHQNSYLNVDKVGYEAICFCGYLCVGRLFKGWWTFTLG